MDVSKNFVYRNTEKKENLQDKMEMIRDPAIFVEIKRTKEMQVK